MTLLGHPRGVVAPSAARHFALAIRDSNLQSLLRQGRMPYFLYKLLGPRPTFPQDITTDERAMMGRHAAYWREYFKDDSLLVFGPVADPRGPYGIAIVQVESEADARRMAEDDPAISSAMGFSYELHPMGAITKSALP